MKPGWGLVLTAGMGCLWSADTQPVLKDQGYLPFAGAPIHYRSSRSLRDPVALLNRELESGNKALRFDSTQGYLPSVLELLEIPVSSQTLVYSKTSLQLQKISPATPRALYFNDNVYVGRVLGAKSLELISFDAAQGAIFYVLSEAQEEKPRFERAQLDCIQCHIASSTRGVPGVMVRSTITTASGAPKGGAPVHTMGHETPMDKRWGGWLVTGGDGSAWPVHNLPESVTSGRYLTPSSDAAAHLVLAHQTQMHNYITEANYRFRLGQPFHPAAEAALRYLLFTGEAALPGSLNGGSFARDFAAQGPRDRHGRSLRDFDLQTRIFRYPCSYLIYSDAFDELPAPVRDHILRRLLEVLEGHDASPDFAHLTPTDRRAILEILLDTKPSVRDAWEKSSIRSHSSPSFTPAPPLAQPQR